MTWQWMSILSVWLLAAVGAVLVGLFSPPGERLIWLPIVLAGAIIVTFSIQLGIQRKEGFVTRVMASVGFSVVILAVATAVMAMLG